MFVHSLNVMPPLVIIKSEFRNYRKGRAAFQDLLHKSGRLYNLCLQNDINYPVSHCRITFLFHHSSKYVVSKVTFPFLEIFKPLAN